MNSSDKTENGLNAMKRSLYILIHENPNLQANFDQLRSLRWLHPNFRVALTQTTQIREMSYAPLRQSMDEPGSSSRPRKNLNIDLNGLDNTLKSWSSSISHKVSLRNRPRKSRKQHTPPMPILSSVFTPIPSDSSYVPPVLPPRSEYDKLVQRVRAAIDDGLHPKMIVKGSSGSYFARGKLNPNDIEIIGVFKPKDEEPYGQLNPKWTKWAHRNFFWWIGFGRSCLIPNLSYISEAAASVLDDRLQLGIVPRTGLVDLASPSFFYEWADRRAWHKKGKALPDKIGSLQTFMHGYKDASNFLAEHPFPGRSSADAFAANRKKRSNNFWRCQPLQLMCGTREGDNDDLFDYDVDADAEWQAHAQLDDDDGDFFSTRQPRASYTDRPFSWTPELQQSFREELEKLVILDYLMRNTDRGLDNFMIQFDPGHTVNRNQTRNGIIDRPPTRNAEPFVPDVSSMSGPSTPLANPQTNSYMPEEQSNPQESLFYDDNQLDVKQSNLNIPRAPSPAQSQSRQSISENRPRIRIAAIDNSLSFPHQHPKGWRSYTYGWLFLPVSLIGQPFSASTRRHFLPLLSDPQWWSETTQALREVFQVDPDFNEGMFSRQMAIVKGQGWNIVQSLRHADEGPLELCRRVKVLVWDDVIDIADNDNEVEEQDITERRYSYTEDEHDDDDADDDDDEVKSLPDHVQFGNRTSRSMDGGSRPSFDKSHTHSASFTPPHSPAQSINSRPVPFSRQRSASIYAKSLDAASGVDVLQHMDQLDAVEHSMHQLANEQDHTQVNNVNAERDDADVDSTRNAEEWLKTYASGNDGSEQRPQRPKAGRISTDTATSSYSRTNSHRMPPAPYKTRKVVVERLETVKGGNPYFETW